MNLGLAFQFIDDALDYGGSTKHLGAAAGHQPQGRADRRHRLLHQPGGVSHW
jgi:hypothetical protein